MKIKLLKLLTINSTLQSIIDNDSTDRKLSAYFKYKLLGIMTALKPYVENFDLVRNEKIKEYGHETDDGKVQISVADKEAVEKFTSDMEKLLNDEIEVTIDKLKAEDVFDSGIDAGKLVDLYDIIETKE